MLPLRNCFFSENCESWMEAFVTEKLTIDWNRMSVVAVAEGRAAALRLKWSTAFLCQSACFNVRNETFMPILDGRNNYIEQLI